ncbi:PAS domain S-box-containing protein/diguanylate cyclase (GGDEF) domain-containing protein [Blastococcus aurantiacus]|uniref:PAS domain S-box-containing protein/diguanylate cyclase (GGDEF) domain-containing protein n=1 Tax=Blastococcus aurantiacus TaxID=1550231 RepID=A0A1G7QBG7_9ACTN|nr:sensor domain-containing diguanylate cyclase [Blastococcus aurantiacus]SDF95843.1 PAS domain S-box-containing protein/diguanylate cyclase (GGDEF) domain-containing protein [Blastococcus aurantiacus]
MTVPAVPTARAAWLHGALVVAVVAAVVSVPMGPWRPAAEIALFCLGIAAVRTAIVHHRTPAASAWAALGAGLAFFALSCLAEVLELAGIRPAASGAAEAVLDVAAYAAMAVGALGVVRAERRRRDRSWLDTATLVLACGLTVVAVSGNGRTSAGEVLELDLGTPVLSVVLLMVCVPLAMSRHHRSVPTAALLAAAALTVLGYGGRMIADAPLRELPLLDPLPLLAVAAMTVAARHPSVARMGAGQDPDDEAEGSRVLGVGTTLLISPALLVLWTIGNGGLGYLLGLGTATLTGLALWRLAALDADREATRVALAASEARLQLLLENAADVIAIVEARTGTITYISPAVQSLLGRPPSYYLGVDAIDLADPRDQPRLRAAVAAAGDAADVHAGAVDTDVRVSHVSGETRWVEMRISGRVNAAGIKGWVVNFREVTDRKRLEDELRQQARTDPLTGLLNRAAFSERLAAATASIEPAAPPAVLFVDIDDFKGVNDSLGHAAGDDLLVAVAGRLTGDVRADDVVARLGGDEFAVLLCEADDERLRDVAGRLLTSLRAPMVLGGTTLSVTASVGGALGAPGDTAERLLHRADTAMYEAKRTGKDSSSLLGSAAASTV